jgi:hypothetical protein
MIRASIRRSMVIGKAIVFCLLLGSCADEIATTPGPHASGGTVPDLAAATSREPLIAPSGTVPARIQLSPKTASLVTGETIQFSAMAEDSSGVVIPDAVLTWTSKDPAIASVDGSGAVNGISAGITAIRVTAGDANTNASVTVSTPVAVPGSSRKGIWISKDELDALAMSGDAWAGAQELRATADAAWTPQPIERQSGQVFHAQALAAALVYARLSPDPSAGAYRAKVADAITQVVSLPVGGGSVTAPSRHLGAWAISADLIDLASLDPTLDLKFRSWLRTRLDHPYSSSPRTIRLSAKQRPNNIGSWARFSLAAASVYLDDSAELDELAAILRFWLGDRTALPVDPFLDVAGGWGAGTANQSRTWQQNPANPATWRGIVSAGVLRNGNRFDGIQPEDHWRGSSGAYVPSTFPGDQSNHRYPEESLEGTLGAVLILHRAGYTDLIDTADRALLRAAISIRYFAESHATRGYHYFTGPHEASRPLITFLYPESGLPDARSRSQLRGRAKGFAWTYWTHAGRSLE